MIEVKNEEYKLNSIFIIESTNKDGEIIRGTGFAISEKNIITANHNLIENFENIKVYISTDNFNDGEYFDAYCIVNNDELDIALLEISGKKNKNYVELYVTSINLDSEVSSCGYPCEKEYNDALIKVKITNNYDNIKTSSYSFEVSQSNTITNYEGMSGAPVLYDKKCIGILIVQQGKNTLYATSIKDIFKNEIIGSKIKSCGANIINQEGFDYKPPEYPKSPFNYCINCYEDDPNIKGVDIGFSFNRWNLSNFIELLYDWVIDYSLSLKDRPNFTGGQRQLFKYAKSNYPLGDINALADLCLHVAIRESYKTIPVMNKVFDLQNKTFSCTHAVLNVDQLELWVGASSVNKTMEEAVISSIENIKYILNIRSLKNRIFALTNQIDSSWPYQDKLKRLSDAKIPLDERFDKIIVPVFIMHDSDFINNYDKNNFLEIFKKHINSCRSLIKSNIPEDEVNLINLRVFCFPVSDIQKINEAFMVEIN
ncbi:Hachiman antiphage defense system protein HamA [Acinetobacter sp. ANC 4636]